MKREVENEKIRMQRKVEKGKAKGKDRNGREETGKRNKEGQNNSESKRK